MTHSATSATAPAGRTVRVRGAALRVLDQGEGPPVLYLHGVGDTGLMLPLIERLSSHRRVVRPDHPGFLHSEAAGTTSVREVAQCHAALLNELGLVDVDVIGCSLGGWIAAELALAAPELVRSLLLVAPVGMPGDGSAPDVFSLAGPALREATVADPVRRAAAPPPSPATIELLARNLSELRRITPAGMSDSSLAPRLSALRCPTKVVWGAADGLLPLRYADDWMRVLPDATLAVVPGAGHVPHAEDPVGFLEASGLATSGGGPLWS